MNEKINYLDVDYKVHFYKIRSRAFARGIVKAQRELLFNQLNEIRNEEKLRKETDLKIKFFHLYYKYRKNQNFIKTTL